MQVTRPLTLEDQHDLFSFLDEYMNANGTTPHVAGIDSEGCPFIGWLDEEGGDSVLLRLAWSVVADGGTYNDIKIMTPLRGEAGPLSYPVTILDRVELAVKEMGDI